MGRLLLLVLLSFSLVGCSNEIAEETSLITETSQLSDEENSTDVMVLDEYTLSDIPDDNLTLPSREQLYYEIPYEGQELDESAVDNILNELTKLCIDKGYFNCSWVDSALDTETITYRFKLDDINCYNLYLDLESYSISVESVDEFEPYDLALADDERKVGGTYYNRDIALGRFDYEIPVTELSDITAGAPLDFFEASGYFDTDIGKAIQYFADTHIVDYNPESDFNILTEAYSNVCYKGCHSAVIEIKGIPYEFVASDDGNHEFIYVTSLNNG